MPDFSEFEGLGEEQVRLKIASLKWQGTQANKAREWIEFSASRRRDAREEKTLLIAKRANTIAIIAAILAAAATIATAVIGVMFSK